MKVKHFTKSLLTHLTCFALMPWDVVANVAIVPDRSAPGNHVVVNKSANGIPLVNINNPNSAGVSHNQFTDFNVGQRGVVINNSTQQGTSIIGGVVLANPNLRNNANLIINEVTSTRPSFIEGPTEIFGKKADYVLANPNGISINGGEFIGTRGITITTGVPVVNSLGELEKLVVSSGSVEFIGKDLNYKNMDYFDVVTSAVKLNVKIHAGAKAKIVTGQNSYDYRAKTSTPISAKKRAAKSTKFAIDTSNLGGVYAGRIAMISTEDGVGVNAGDMSSMSGDIEITANGDIIHKDMRSAGSVNVTSKSGNIYITRGGKSNEVSAKKEISYNAAKQLINSGSRIVSDSPKGIIFAAEEITNDGAISARGGDIGLNAKVDITNNGILLALFGVKAESDKNFANTGEILAGGNVGINAFGNVQNHGKINSTKGAVSAFSNTGGISNTGSVEAQSDITFDALLDLENQGLLKGQNFVLTRSRLGEILNYGNVLSDNSVEIDSALGVLNQGNIFANRGLLDVGGNFTNKGEVATTDVLRIVLRGDFVNLGKATSESMTQVDSRNLYNRGDLASKGVTAINLSGSMENYAGATIESAGNMDIILARDFTNGGEIKSGKVLDIDSGGRGANTGQIISGGKKVIIVSDASVINSGAIGGGALKPSTTATSRGSVVPPATGNMSYLKIHSAGDFLNNGTVTSQEAEEVEINATAGMTNTGLVEAQNILKLDANILDNNLGTIKSEGAIEVSVASDFINTSGKLEGKKGGSITIAGELLNDSGKILFGKSTLVSSIVAGSAIVNGSGKISAMDGLLVQSGREIKNDLAGSISSGKDLTVAAMGDIFNHGTFKSSSDMKLTSATGNIETRGSIISAAKLSLETATGKVFADTGSKTQSKDELSISAKDIAGEGNMLSDAGVKIVSASAFTNEFDISSKGKVEISVANGDFVNKKLVHAEEGAKLISVAGAILNEGTISVNGVDSTLEASSGVINSGEIKGKTAELMISSPNQAIENSGKIDLEGKINTTSAVLVNTGDVNAGKGGSIIATQEFKNTQTINHYDGTLKVDTLKLENEGTLAGKKLIVGENTLPEINNGATGTIFTTETMELNGKSLTNSTAKDGGILSSGTISGKFTEDIKNDGLIFAQAALELESSTGEITNNKEINSSGTMALTAASDITNSAKIIAKDAMTVTSGTKLVNNADLLSTGSMDITAPALENSGHLGSSKKLTAQIANDLTNRGTMEGGGIEMRVGGTIDNDRHNIQSTDDIVITDLFGGKVKRISNVAGIIDSTQGNVDISAHELYQPATVNIRYLAEQNIKDGKETPIATPVTNPPINSNSGDNDSRTHTRTTITTSLFNDTYLGKSNAAAIHAGKNLNLSVDRIYSIGSEISSVSGLSSSPIVDAQTLYQHKLTHEEVYKHSERKKRTRWTRVGYWETTSVTTDINLTVNKAPIRTIGMEVSGKNVVIRPALTYDSPVPSNISSVTPSAAQSHASFTPLPVKASAPSAPKGPGQITLSNADLKSLLATMKAKFSTDPVDFDHGTHKDPKIAAALAQAKWHQEAEPGNYYIQEKSIVFTDPAGYFGTEDFIKRIPGYNPGQETTLMGDRIKQHEFIKRQMLDMTGFATMYAGEDPSQIIKKMYENAEEEARDLNLRPGLTMAAAQVAELKKDMIWPENITMEDGTVVTVPRVYLAKSRPVEKQSGIRASENVDIQDENATIGENITAQNVKIASRNGSLTVLAGAKIKARDSVAFSSASSTNLAGTVVAAQISSHSAGDTQVTGSISGEHVSLTSEGSINNSGLVQAAVNLSIAAAADVTNIGGQIESQGNAQVLAGRNFVQETEVTRHGDGHNYTDVAGARPELNVAGHLAVNTAGDYVDVGSITKAGSVSEDVGGNRVIGSAVLEREVSYGSSSKNYYKAHDVTHISSTYEVAGSIDSQVKGNLAVLGSVVKAGSDASYDVGGNVQVASLVDIRHEEGASSSSSRSWYGGKNSQSSSFTNHSEELVSAGIESGGKTRLKSSGDQAYVGADLSSKDGTKLEGHNIEFLTQDTSNEQIKSKSSRGTFWQTSHNQGSTGTKVNETRVAGPLSVEASGTVLAEVKAEGSKLEDVIARSVKHDAAIHSEQTTDDDRGNNVTIIRKSDQSSSWDKKQRGLTPEGTLLISAAMSVMTAGSTTGVLDAALAAVKSSLQSSLVTGTINNGGDVGKGFKVATSRGSLVGALKGGATAGLTQGVTGAFVPGNMASLQGVDKAVAITKQEFIRASVGGVINGQAPGDIIKSAALSSALANVQNKIGDLGQGHGVGGTLQDGGLTKTALHAAVGGAFSAASGGSVASGALGGAVSEQLASHIAPKGDVVGKGLVGLTAATAVAFTGGNSKDMGVTSKVAESAVEYNSWGLVLKIADKLNKLKKAQNAAALAKGAAARSAASKGGVEVVKDSANIATKAVQGEAKVASNAGGKNLVQSGEKGGKLPVVRGADGKIKTVKYTQKHHIVPQELKKHPLLKRAGVDIDDASNLVRLPTTKGSGITTTSRSVHQGRHVKEVRESIERKMNSVLRSGKVQGYTQEQYRDKLQQIIRKEYKDLKTGDRVLNAAKDLRKSGGKP